MKKTLLLTFLFLLGIQTVHSQLCGGIFTDPAGANADYSGNTNYTITITPTNPTDKVTVTFTAFNTEENRDALYVFDGNSASAPQIASGNPVGSVPGGLAGGFWGTTIPGPFTSSSPDGCLTFTFRSNASGSRSGWIANVTCAPPDECQRPTNITAVPSATSINLNWAEHNSATAWEIEVQPIGAPQTGIPSYPAYTGNLPFTATNLQPETCYTFYIRSVCSPTSNSSWAQSINFCTNALPAACGGQFVDSGGVNGNYANNEDRTTTICPANAGDLVTVTFVSFSMEANFDALYVFNGNSIASAQIPSTNGAGNVPGNLAGGYWGYTNPGPFTSSSPDGCLTFRFRSDDTQMLSGWVANVTCAPPPSCTAPTSLSRSGLTAFGATFSWTQPPNPNSSVATNWEVLTIPVGFPAPNGPGIPITTNTFTATTLLPSTCYNFYVRAVCSPTDTSAWVSINFCTAIAPPICGGFFVDNGNTTGNYSNNSDNTYVICPTNPGEVVNVVFSSFNTEAGWDALYVFDGNSISAPQIASNNPSNNVPGGLDGGYWGSTIPGPFTSSSPDGCLTFRFRSDNSTNASGWFANVTCIADSDKIVLIAFVDSNTNGVKDANEVYFPNGSFIYQQNNNGINVNGYSPTGQFRIYDTNPNNTYSFSYQVLPEYSSYINGGNTTFSNISIAAGSGAQFLYFPVTVTQPYNDVAVSIAPVTVPRPGLTYTNEITYQNLGLAATNGTITFTKPPPVTNVAVNQTGIVSNVSGFTYAFTNLLPYETRSFVVTMSIPTVPVVNANDLLTSTVEVIATGTDINLDNNFNSNSQIVVNSFDPNDKMESRGKTIPFNTFAEDDYFFYTIRFQNDGTANAIDVRIGDVLNATKIDETSVLMMSSSHNYTMKRIGNQLIWDFKNIFLTPSSLNLEGSRGYVQFKVKLKPGFQSGDIIPNNASIYFDTNPAIVTATFNSKFVTLLDVTDFNENSLVMYPNPANNTVQIDLINTHDELNKVVFYDMLGKAVKTILTIPTDNMTIDVSDLSRGVYLVEISSETNHKITKKLVIQ